MKEIIIKVIINEQDNKIATMMKAKGYNKESLSNQLEILGIFENLISIQKDKIKVLMKETRN